MINHLDLGRSPRDAESTHVRERAFGEIFGPLWSKDVFCCFSSREVFIKISPFAQT
jgi:hypothetical protein